MAHAYATADRAMICWTLGITEHHNAVDNVLALINLALLTGHVGRYGSGLNPLRGQNNVQGGGDMGALPDRLPGFQHVENDAAARASSSARGASPMPPKKRLAPDARCSRRWSTASCTALYVIGENPAQSEADQTRTPGSCSRASTAWSCRTSSSPRPREMADVVLPGGRRLVRGEGTVTNSERRVQRVRKALDAAGRARATTSRSSSSWPRRLGHDWGEPDAETIWNELRALSPVHAGMSYARLESEGGLQWPCYDETHPGELFLHSRLWERPVRRPAGAVPRRSSTTRRSTSSTPTSRSGSPPAAGSTSTTPACRPAGYASPLRRGETLDISPEDAGALGVARRRASCASVAARQRRGAGAHRRRRCGRGSPS